VVGLEIRLFGKNKRVIYLDSEITNRCVYRKLDPDVLVMKSAQNGT
jgi:hypothetical protein